MIGGPFARFRHEHHFEAHNGTTRLTDTVEFRTRSGPMTPVSDILAGAYLQRLLSRRNEAIQKKAETSRLKSLGCPDLAALEQAV